MLRTAYVIQEVGYAYNDEYYYRPEGNGGIAKLVFFDRAKAEQKVLELVADKVLQDVHPPSWQKELLGNPQKMCGPEPFIYSYRYEDCDFNEEQYDQFCESLTELLGPNSFEKVGFDDLHDWHLPAGLSREQKMVIAKMLIDMGVVFYEIVKVEVDDT